MADIEIVRISKDAKGSTFRVQITEHGTVSAHEVRLRTADFGVLSGGTMSEEQLLRASFVFLLEREPKESILREFDIMTIARYFPEYPDAMKGLW